MRRFILGLSAGFSILGGLAGPALAQDNEAKAALAGFEVSAPITIGAAPHGMWRFGETLAIAVSGEDKIALLDLPTGEITKTIPVVNVPLDVRPAPYGGFWVTQFRGTTINRVDNAGKVLQSIEAGKSPSLFSSGGSPDRWSVVSEFADQLTVFNPASGNDVQTNAIGERPYPAAVLRDGSVAFIPLRGENAVQIYDLLQGRELGKVGNCEEPEGGDLSADEKWYLAACNDVVLWINTGDYTRTHRTPGIGPRPFSVLAGQSGRFAYVNNAGGDTVSVIDMRTKAVIGALTTGQQPIVMREFDGKIYVTNEVAGTLNIITPPAPH